MSDKKISQLTAATTPLAGTEVLPVVQGGETKKVTVDNLTAGKNVNATVFTASSWMFVTPSVDTNNALYRVSNAGGTGYLGIDNSAGGLSGSVYSLVLRHTGNYPISFWNGSTEKLNIATTGDVNVKTGNLVIGTAGKGIDFSATSQATGMTSELFSDYEEGTWTPVDSSGAGLTLSSATGSYTKIGNLVIARCNFTFPATANTNTISIGGLPFSVGSASQNRQGFFSYSTAGGTAGDTVLPAASATTFQFRANGGVARTNAEYTSAIVFVTCIYGV